MRCSSRASGGAGSTRVSPVVSGISDGEDMPPSCRAPPTTGRDPAHRAAGCGPHDGPPTLMDETERFRSIHVTANGGPMADRKPTGTRPRVEGERESEILEAALALLAQVGYDRMTMDAVAAEAKAGKATLYRRWSTKASLVVDALLRSKQALQAPSVDTGSLREDLIAMSCGQGGLTDQQSAGVMAGVI